MPLHLAPPLANSKAGADPSKPCQLMNLPQETIDQICGYVIEAELDNEYASLWLFPCRHQGTAYIGIPNQIPMANCNHELHSTITKILIRKYLVGATLSLDSLHYLDLEDTLRAVGSENAGAIRSLTLVVHGGSSMTISALLKWARLSFDGALAGNHRLDITYDMEGCWDEGYDPCGDTHTAFIEPLLKELRAIAIRTRAAVAGQIATGTMSQAGGANELQDAVLEHLGAQKWRLPATNFCHGCRFNGLRFEHEEFPDYLSESDFY